MMRIWINARFVTQALTGVQRYACELSRRLIAFDPGIEMISPGVAKPAYADLVRSHALRLSRFSAGRILLPGHAWEQLFLPIELPRNALLFSPGNTGPLSIGRQVVMIHDTAPLEHPEWYSRAFASWYKLLIPHLARRVRLVITNSEYSRQRIIACTGISGQKVVAIPLGVDSRFHIMPESTCIAQLRGLGITGPYLLTVGALSSRKNCGRLFQAWTQSGGHAAGVSLVVIGDVGSAFSDLSSCGQLPAGVMHLGRVPDDRLAALYNGATAFVYPSLYEGFGLTTLEAMRCGTPVIASNAAALPETVGEAAMLVDPLDVASLAEGIRRLLADDDLRLELRDKGLQHAQKYTWDRTAETTWNALQSIIET